MALPREDRFIKVYSNIPLRIREEIVIVIDGEPISWNVAYKEIVHETEKGKKIIDTLIKLEVI